LCLSKTEGLSEFIIESLKVIAEKETAPDGYTGLSKTADSEQKAWRKKQIVYRLSKRHQVTQAVTDIILCSKFKYAPEGFLTAGEINGVIICYKLTLVSTLSRELPALPNYINNNNNSINNVGQQIENLKLHSKPLYPSPFDHEYENLRKSFQISPNRPAPKPPLVTQTSTLGPGHAAELEGVPFTLNPNLIDSTSQAFTLPTFNTNKLDGQLDYDFNLERQIMCSTKIPLTTHSAANLNSPASRNPFFN
jgi:ESCRT-I complex subunit MVB12